MSIEFDQDNEFMKIYANKNSSSSSGGINNWLVKKGIAKDSKGADMIMIIVSVVCFAIAIYFAVK
jgi:hypothetical protein